MNFEFDLKSCRGAADKCPTGGGELQGAVVELGEFWHVSAEQEELASPPRRSVAPVVTETGGGATRTG
jgi:hypothetical protein